MKITPKQGYVLASNFKLPIEKKGLLILKYPEECKGYMKIESPGVSYEVGQIVLPHQYKPKLLVGENLYLIEECDIIAVVEV
jgi:hypothetical protein